MMFKTIQKQEFVFKTCRIHRVVYRLLYLLNSKYIVFGDLLVCRYLLVCASGWALFFSDAVLLFFTYTLGPTNVYYTQWMMKIIQIIHRRNKSIYHSNLYGSLYRLIFSYTSYYVLNQLENIFGTGGVLLQSISLRNS